MAVNRQNKFHIGFKVWSSAFWFKFDTIGTWGPSQYKDAVLPVYEFPLKG